MPLIPSKSADAAASILSRVQNLAGNYNACATHLLDARLATLMSSLT